MIVVIDVNLLQNLFILRDPFTLTILWGGDAKPKKKITCFARGCTLYMDIETLYKPYRIPRLLADHIPNLKPFHGSPT